MRAGNEFNVWLSSVTDITDFCIVILFFTELNIPFIWNILTNETYYHYTDVKYVNLIHKYM